MKFSIGSGQADGVNIAVDVASKNRNLFRITEIRKNDSREVTWFLDDEETFSGNHTLSVRKVKTDWMLFGSEEYHVDGLESTPAAYQRDFSQFGVQRLITDYQQQLKQALVTATCRSDCSNKDDAARREGNY